MSFPDEAATAPSEADGSPPVPPAPPDPAPLTDPDVNLAVVDAPDSERCPRRRAFRARVSAQRPLPRIIAVANQKGGVGKTTTTINVGACLAELGQRTLIIDLDPQGNASTGLGIENRGLETSMYHVLMHEVPLENCIEPTDVKGLFVAPASLDLAGAEIELVPAFSRETRLQAGDRRRARRLRLRAHRLPAVARPAHRQRSQRGPRGARPDPVRVLRAGGPRAAAAQRRPRAPQPQPGARGQHDRVRDVRRPHQARRPGRQRGARALRREGAAHDRARAPCGCPRRRRSASRSSRSILDPAGAVAYRDVAKEVHDDSAQRVG